VNTAAPLGVPASDPPASAFTGDQLGSISRAVTMNDPQLGDGTAEGGPKDRNVELLVDDPRTVGRPRAGSGRRRQVAAAASTSRSRS
jgi:hypothetical protein